MRPANPMVPDTFKHRFLETAFVQILGGPTVPTVRLDPAQSSYTPIIGGQAAYSSGIRHRRQELCSLRSVLILRNTLEEM
jgi:hypothetical protein